MNQPDEAGEIEAVWIPPVQLAGLLSWPRQAASGLVLFAHGSGSSRASPRNRQVAAALRHAGMATLLFDLLTEEEAEERENVFDVDLLANRLLAAARWARDHPATQALPLAYFGASTGAAAALAAAARRPDLVSAVVSRGGRPDLAGAALHQVRAPTLLIVGGADHGVLELNQAAFRSLACEKRFDVIPGATHLFEEPGTLDAVTDHASRWFLDHWPSGGP